MQMDRIGTAFRVNWNRHFVRFSVASLAMTNQVCVCVWGGVHVSGFVLGGKGGMWWGMYVCVSVSVKPQKWFKGWPLIAVENVKYNNHD